MKKIGIALGVITLFLLAQSCNKRCQCIGYDGGIVEYSAEEVSAQGKTCSEMIYYPGLTTQRYPVCEWIY